VTRGAHDGHVIVRDGDAQEARAARSSAANIRWRRWPSGPSHLLPRGRGRRRALILAALKWGKGIEVFEPRRVGCRKPSRTCRRADAGTVPARSSSGRQPRAPWCWRSDSVAPFEPATSIGIAQAFEHGGFAAPSSEGVSRGGGLEIAPVMAALQRAACRKRQAVDPDSKRTFDRRRLHQGAGSSARSAMPAVLSLQLRVKNAVRNKARTISSSTSDLPPA